jgi:hypothetical protein
LGNIFGIPNSHWILTSSAQTVIGQMANSSQMNANMFRNICCDLLTIDDPFPEGFLKSLKALQWGYIFCFFTPRILDLSTFTKPCENPISLYHPRTEPL